MVFGFGSTTDNPDSKILAESKRMLSKHPNKCIAYVQKLNPTKSGVPDIKNPKFIIPNDIKFGEFCSTIRKKIGLLPQEGLFFFVGRENKESVCMTEELGSIYERLKSNDLRLYVYYDTENVFGGNNL